MTKVLKVIIILACASAVWAFQSKKSTMSPQQQQDIEKAVLKVHKQMVQADADLDVDKFFSYILDFDKGLIIRDGQLFKTRQEAFDVIKTAFEAISRIKRTYEQTHITVISPQTALLTAQGTSTVTLTDGRILEGPFALTMVYVLRDGKWKVLHGHFSIPNRR
jgi:uncharacterized protein (TIGR02246 family)